MKEQDKPPEKTTNHTEINNLPDRVQSISNRMLTKLGKTIDEHSDHFNKELENIKN